MCLWLRCPRMFFIGRYIPCTKRPWPECPDSELHLQGCNVSQSPTDVSPTKNSWMLHPLGNVSLGYFAPDRTIPSLNSDFIERSDTRLTTAAGFSAAKRCSSMCGPSVHPTEGRQSNKPGQGRRRSRPDAPLIHWVPEADRASSMLDAVQGRDTLVRGTNPRDALFKGRNNIQEFSVGDTLVGDTSTLHPCRHWIITTATQWNFAYLTRRIDCIIYAWPLASTQTCHPCQPPARDGSYEDT